MSYAEAIFTILCAGVGAGIAAALVHRLVDIDMRRRHHEVGSVIFLQLGVVFAVLLAFVFSEDWSQYNQAAQAIDLEVSAMHGVAMIAATLPPPDAGVVLSSEEAYLESVIDKEWPVLSRRRTEDAATDQKLSDLIQDVAKLRLSDPDERDKKNAMLSLLAAAHTQRETRIYQAQSGIPLPLWWVLIGFTIVLSVFVLFSAIEYRTSAVATAVCFTTGIVSILVMARLLDYPFEGALALHPTDFVDVAGKVSNLLDHSRQ